MVMASFEIVFEKKEIFTIHKTNRYSVLQIISFIAWLWLALKPKLSERLQTEFTLDEEFGDGF